MTAIEFFELHKDNDEKVKKLLEQCNRYLWETQKTSVFSPCVVNTCEVLMRDVDSPVFIDPTGTTLLSTYFADIYRRGMSVDRLLHSCKNDILERATKRNDSINSNRPSDKKRTLMGFIELKVSEIRDFTSDKNESENPQILGIYDTALEANLSHADICCLVPSTNALKKEVNDFFLAQVKNFICIECFSGENQL